MKVPVDVYEIRDTGGSFPDDGDLLGRAMDRRGADRLAQERANTLGRPVRVVAVTRYQMGESWPVEPEES